MIRLIAVDLDGTLLRSDGVLPPEGARTLADAARRGMRVVRSTRSKNKEEFIRWPIYRNDPLIHCLR
ncbi:MAG: HAD family hydrolase [Anaerolineae bacterium]